jgi:predicted nucleotidyltransferase component of viral defense system
MRSALQVLPDAVAKAVVNEDHWFLIGGQAVRCFVPYRPSLDVDFGVTSAQGLKRLEARLKSTGRVEVIERAHDTVHLNFEGIDISLFVLPHLKAHVKDHVLTLTGLFATKLHALFDRGTRRDFFDLYVLLDTQRMGLSECMAALSTVYQQPVNQGLLLRALCYFDDADAEAPLPGEGPGDWKAVKAFFSKAVGALVVPPSGALSIQRRVVNVTTHPSRARSSRPKR